MVTRSTQNLFHGKEFRERSNRISCPNKKKGIFVSYACRKNSLIGPFVVGILESLIKLKDYVGD